MSEPKPPIINITGKTPNGQVLLQSAPDVRLLQIQLIAYFERGFGSANALNDVKTLQKVLNTPASKVPELNMYEFEANQRVFEVAITLLIARSVNKLENRAFIPAWQRSGQSEPMKDFTKKESWDGFIYEHPDSDADPVATFPIEAKSLMVDPKDNTVTSPNQLLKDMIPKYKDYFQAEGSICALFVPPYTASGHKLSFDLKTATEEVNKVVAYEAMGCICLLSFPENDQGETEVTIHCHFVNKNPLLGENGNIDHVNLTKMKFGKIK